MEKKPQISAKIEIVRPDGLTIDHKEMCFNAKEEDGYFFLLTIPPVANIISFPRVPLPDVFIFLLGDEKSGIATPSRPILIN